MKTFSVMTGKNILVGDEVSGSVKARVVNEDWDDVLETSRNKNLPLYLTKKQIVGYIKRYHNWARKYARERQAKQLRSQQSETLDPIDRNV